jgi:tRNA A37 N6-isopentenylltransferase MiaA
VVIAGGTSLYLQALRRGLVNTPPPDPALRAFFR